jgi:hypothetical protein
VTVGGDQGHQLGGDFEGSEFDDENMSKFEADNWNKPPIADGGFLGDGMNAMDSSKKGAMSQIKRTPIVVSELVNIDDIEMSDTDGDPPSLFLNRSKVSPLVNIFGKADTKPNVPIRNQNFNYNYPSQPSGFQGSYNSSKALFKQNFHLIQKKSSNLPRFQALVPLPTIPLNNLHQNTPKSHPNPSEPPTIITDPQS